MSNVHTTLAKKTFEKHQRLQNIWRRLIEVKKDRIDRHVQLRAMQLRLTCAQLVVLHVRNVCSISNENHDFTCFNTLRSGTK